MNGSFLVDVNLPKHFNFFNDNWVKIQSEIENSRLIIAKEYHIECIR